MFLTSRWVSTAKALFALSRFKFEVLPREASSENGPTPLGSSEAIFRIYSLK